MPVRGTTPSLMIIRICGSGTDVHARTDGYVSGKAGWNAAKRVRWNWTFVAKGAISTTRNERCFGIWVYGKGPVLASVVKLRAVKTVVRLSACFLP